MNQSVSRHGRHRTITITTTTTTLMMMVAVVLGWFSSTTTTTASAHPQDQPPSVVVPPLPVPGDVNVNNNDMGPDCVLCTAVIPICPPCEANHVCVRSLIRTCEMCPSAQCILADAAIPEGFSKVVDGTNGDPNVDALITSMLSSVPTDIPTNNVNVTDFVGVTVVDGTTIVNFNKPTRTAGLNGGNGKPTAGSTDGVNRSSSPQSTVDTNQVDPFIVSRSVMMTVIILTIATVVAFNV